MQEKYFGYDLDYVAAVVTYYLTCAGSNITGFPVFGNYEFIDNTFCFMMLGLSSGPLKLEISYDSDSIESGKLIIDKKLNHKEFLLKINGQDDFIMVADGIDEELRDGLNEKIVEKFFELRHIKNPQQLQPYIDYFNTNMEKT